MLTSLGFNESFQEHLDRLNSSRSSPLIPARIRAEHRGSYELLSASGEQRASVSGRMRHNTLDPSELPTVGDWVGVNEEGLIEAVLPRSSLFLRKAAGTDSHPQAIAANVDRVFIVTSANQDFNPRRIERYVAAVLAGGAQPILVLNKVDLCDDLNPLLDSLDGSCRALPLVQVSALNKSGHTQLAPFVESGKTLALVGSSGVGKSTLANWLLGSEQLDTDTIRSGDDHGKHTTTARSLFVLPQGGCLIDTPGMRQFALWSEQSAEVRGFEDIDDLKTRCRFHDCQHSGQPGCAVEAALLDGTLTAKRLANHEKLQRELAHQQKGGSVASRQAIKRRGRELSAQIRQITRAAKTRNLL